MKQLIIILAVMSAGSSFTYAQNVLDHWYRPNRAVHDIVVDSANGIAYLAGDFTVVGTNQRNVAAVHRQTGDVALGWAQPNSSVLACISDGEGGWFIAGHFTAVGSTAQNRVAQLTAAGALTSWNPNVTGGSVTKLLLVGNTLLLAGTFSAVGGQARSGFAAVDPATGAVLPWNPISGGVAVLSCSSVGDTVYVGGSFLEFAGEPRSRLASFVASTGALLPWAPTASGHVTAITATDSAVYIGGTFTSVNGVNRNRIAAITTTTGDLLPWNPDANGTVNEIHQTPDRVFALGTFSSIGGAPRNGLAALDTVSGFALAWNPGFSLNSLPVKPGTMLLANQSVWVGGDFDSVNGESQRSVACLDPTTADLVAWNPAPCGNVRALAASGSDVIVAGSFACMNELVRGRLCAIDLATGRPTSWNPRADSTVHDLVLKDSVLFAGGYFSSINLQQRSRFAAISTHTGIPIGPIAHITSSFDPRIITMELADSLLLLGGYIGGAGGVPADGIALLNVNTGSVAPTGLSTNGTVYDIKMRHDTVFIAGAFGNVNGWPRSNLAAFKLSTYELLDWSPDVNWPVHEVLVEGNTVYLAGDFHYVNGEARRGLASVDRTTGATLPWLANTDQAARALALRGAHLVTGGSFTTINELSQPGVGIFDKGTGTLLPWTTPIREMPPTVAWRNFKVHTIAFHDTLMLVGGNFGAIGDLSRSNFAAVHFCPSWPYYYDADGDGHGNPEESISQCPPLPPGYVLSADDCDDGEAGAWIGSPCDDGNPSTADDTWNADCTCIGELTTVIADGSAAQGLLAAPNPVLDVLRLSEAIDGVVCDAQGRVFITLTRSSHVDTRTIGAGIYLLRSSDGRVLRFVKE